METQTLKLNASEAEMQNFKAVIDGSSSYPDAKKRLEGQGCKPGEAVRLIAKLKPEMYNAHRKANG